jgi:hypothetical protein
MQKKLGLSLSLKHFIFPKNNHWLKRILMVFSFIFFDYFSTMIFCRVPSEEANVYARLFMESFGVQAGLTIFVLVANLPVYVTLTLDSHLVRFPQKMAVVAEVFTDFVFAWFIAGLHFNGGTSWFWQASSSIRQVLGAVLYLVGAFVFIKPYKPCYNENGLSA